MRIEREGYGAEWRVSLREGCVAQREGCFISLITGSREELQCLVVREG